MDLGYWLMLPNKDGTRRRRIDLAAECNVVPAVITAWVDGTAWPTRRSFEALIQATRGQVGPTDFLSLDARKLIAKAKPGRKRARPRRRG